MIINRISPFSTDKNIGGANNHIISKFGNDDWIVLTDGDASFMLPNWGEQIEMIIKANPEYDLIGCVTNRIGIKQQLHNGVFDSVCNAYDCYYDALEAWEKHGTLVVPADIVSGVCMIFKKSTWEKAGGFLENNRSADAGFNRSIKRIGGKIGIAKGLYMMHNYRIWHTDYKRANNDVKHLVR